MTAKIEGAYTVARDRYAEAGVDTDEALQPSSRSAHLAALLAG